MVTEPKYNIGMQITRNTTPNIFVDEMLKSDLADRCRKQGFVDGDDTEQFNLIALHDTELSTDEINVAFRDFERAIKGLKKQYVLIDLESNSQQILPEHAVESAIRDLERIVGPVACWVCEEYIVIEVAAE